jgi:hypothetical protein
MPGRRLRREEGSAGDGKTEAARDRERVSSFFGGGERDDSKLLDYEATLQALLSLLGRPVLVLFSGTAETPFIAGVISGRLDRGEPDERMQALLLRDDVAPVETLFFHVGSRQSGFVLRPDEFDHGFWQADEQLTIHLGNCAVTILVHGELGQALQREQPGDDG